MLRKREKFIKAWMLKLFILVAIAIIMWDFKAFVIMMTGLVCIGIAISVVYFICGKIKSKNVKYLTAYQLYREIRRRLFFMGYDVRKIFGDEDEVINSLNYRLVRISGEDNIITSVDIATAIMHAIVSVDDEEDFIFNMFLCVMDKLMAPRRYKVTVDEDNFTVFETGNAMERANIEKYIMDMGIKKFSAFLKEMYVADTSLRNTDLWYIYVNACG